VAAARGTPLVHSEADYCTTETTTVGMRVAPRNHAAQKSSRHDDQDAASRGSRRHRRWAPVPQAAAAGDPDLGRNRREAQARLPGDELLAMTPITQLHEPVAGVDGGELPRRPLREHRAGPEHEWEPDPERDPEQQATGRVSMSLLEARPATTVARIRLRASSRAAFRGPGRPPPEAAASLPVAHCLASARCSRSRTARTPIEATRTASALTQTGKRRFESPHARDGGANSSVVHTTT
jgi:hypothetical protein